MKSFRRLGLVLVAACGLELHAADPVLDPRLSGVHQIIDSGRLEIARQLVDRDLVKYPEDPRLLALRTRLADTLALSRDDPAALPPSVEPPAPIANRRAESGRNFTTGTADIPMLWVKPGSFWMCDPIGSDDDTQVTLSNGYWLGRTEVTQEQWQAVMENQPSPSHFKGSDRPVENIAWNSAMEFCRKLTESERAAGRLPAGYVYTLPTEAQWEYACRAGTTGPFAGDVDAMAWYEANSGGQTHPVAQKRPNTWGFYDMHGNVCEWCLDGYRGYPGGHVVDPMIGYDGPSAAMHRMLRGGSYATTAGQCRSGQRYRQVMNYTFYALGFRLALAPLRAGATADPESRH